VSVAREIGVDHVVRHACNRGLARTFRTGLDAALRLGADIIVNTDGDNQYAGRDIPRLVEPILRGEAEMVVGDRQTDKVPHFSAKKKLLQRWGSLVVRKLSGTDVVDTVSGFRAFSREAALQLNVVSSFSYTIETIIQAGRKQIAVTSVPIGTNGKTRESRLFKSIPQFLGRSAATIVRMYSMYHPLKVFCIISLVLMLAGCAPIARFLFYWLSGDQQGHVQSLILGGVLVMMGFVTLITGLLADLISFNRQLLEMTLEKMRRLELRVEDERQRLANLETAADLQGEAVGVHASENWS
jgi:hypothetical protein